MPTIQESFLLTASNSDILIAPSRLTAIPRPGLMTIQASITDADATNHGLITLQLPDAHIPFEDLHVPRGAEAADFTLNSEFQFTFAFTVGQGGHVLYTYTEVGTVALFFTVITLQF